MTPLESGEVGGVYVCVGAEEVKKDKSLSFRVGNQYLLLKLKNQEVAMQAYFPEILI